MPAPRVQSPISRNLKALALALAVAFAVVTIQLLEPVTHVDLLSAAELKLIDLRFRMRGVKKPSGEVVIVAVDSKSIEALGRWPWSRSQHAQLI